MLDAVDAPDELRTGPDRTGCTTVVTRWHYGILGRAAEMICDDRSTDGVDPLRAATHFLIASYGPRRGNIT